MNSCCGTQLVGTPGALQAHTADSEKVEHQPEDTKEETETTKEEENSDATSSSENAKEHVYRFGFCCSNGGQRSVAFVEQLLADLQKLFAPYPVGGGGDCCVHCACKLGACD